LEEGENSAGEVLQNVGGPAKKDLCWGVGPTKAIRASRFDGSGTALKASAR